MLLAALLGLLCAAGLFAVFHGMAGTAVVRNDRVEKMLKGYGELEAASIDEIELQRPFSERVLRPLLERAGKLLSDRTPARSTQAMRAKLSMAGNPANLTVGGFQAMRAALGGLLLVLGALLGALVGQGAIGVLVGGLAGAAIGFFGPMMWIKSIGDKRRKLIQKALPDAMDLLTISSEAGQSFDAAVKNVVDKYHNPLTEEFAKVLLEVQLGRPRMEALEDMGKRTGVEDVNNFVQQVIQSEQMGVGIAKILRIQSTELRRRRRQRGQALAAQASLKMMLPMVGCIFPTLWIILLGPAILVVLKAKG